MKKRILFFLISFLFFFSTVSALNKAPVDITKMSISDINDAFDKGYLNSELLVNLYLDRINEYDDMYNSINQINPNAIEDAKRLDQERLDGKIRGPLHGIPILVKTNIDVKGIATTAGAKALADNYPDQDSYVVSKLVDAGAIILGSTNMSEFAFSANNSYSSYGWVRNAFDPEYTSYGSSGGSATSLAAGFAAITLGTDTNSSVRIPAAGAGVIGLRPTLGLVSRNGVIPYDIERDTVGIMSKTIEDNALILSIISGEDSNDSYTDGVSRYDFSTLNSSSDMSGYTIGIVRDFLYGANGSGVISNTDSSIVSLADNSIEKMKEAGANIVYIDGFYLWKYASIHAETYAGITMCDNFNEYIKGTSGTIRSFTQLASAGGKVNGLWGYNEGCNHNYSSKSTRDSKKQVYKDYVESVYDNYGVDVLVYLSIKNKPYAYNGNGVISPGSSLVSVIGYASISVPMGMSDGFSYSLEFMSKPYEEGKLLNITNAFTKVNGNSVDVPSIVPALYDIDNNVIQLMDIYNGMSKDHKLYQEIHDYFYTYNDNQQVVDDAIMLIDKFNNYKEEDNALEVISKKTKGLGINIIYIILGIVGLFVLYVIYRIIRRKIRRYLRKKRKLSRRK